MRARTALHRAAAIAATMAAVALVASGCAAAPSVAIDTPAQVQGALPDETRAQLEAAVTHAMAATGSSGAIVGVWVPWSGEWVTGLGTQSPGDTTPIDTDMAFRIADATRPMTCDILYGAAADGKVSLDDSVSTYVTGVPDLEDVTLLDLCNGTSGAGAFQGDVQGMWLNNPDREWNPRELATYGLGHSRSPIGAFRESDAGYLLLGIALENATGKTAAALLDAYVADPLDLEHTLLPSPQAGPPAVGPVLDGHYSVNTPEGTLNCAEPIDITELSSSIGFTDSGATSTIDDLGRYAKALGAGALDREGQPDRWKTPLPVSADAPTWYQTTGGAYLAGSLIGQHGSVPGYITAVYTDPGTGMTVAVALNNSTAGGGIGAYLAWELAAIASKAPAAGGQNAPDFGLPWTADQYHEAIAAAAICPIP